MLVSRSIETFIAFMGISIASVKHGKTARHVHMRYACYTRLVRQAFAAWETCWQAMARQGFLLQHIPLEREVRSEISSVQNCSDDDPEEQVIRP